MNRVLNITEPGMARVHLDYNEFGELATSAAQRLNDLGENRERVALILDNSVEWAALSYGAMPLALLTP